MQSMFSVCPLLLLASAVVAAEQRASSAAAAGAMTYRIEWSTLIGGSQYDDLREIIVGDDGTLLVGGMAMSPDMPITEGALQPTYAGDRAGTGHPGLVGGDCYLARLSPDGRRILAATYFGGSKQERDVYGMALDRQGDIVITTTTRSPDIATTPGTFQRKYAGGINEVVVAKLSADLRKVLWCTYLGGSDSESPRGGLAIDPDDCVYVVGVTQSKDFPTTPGTLQPARAGDDDAFVAKLKPDGSGLAWCTLLGGSGREMIIGARVDAKGRVYVTGYTYSADFPVSRNAAQRRPGGECDAFLAALAPDASRLLFCTRLGGKGVEFPEHRMALLGDGSMILTGVTRSPDFPTTPGVFQRQLRGKNAGFVTRLSPDGSRFVFSTFLGGSGGEFLLMPTLDGRGTIYLVGHTASNDFPVTPGALQKTYGGGDDGVFAVLSPDGSQLLYATYLGGKGEDLLRSIALGRDGSVYLIGKTASDDFPVTFGAAQTTRHGGLDSFVVKLVPAP